MAASIAERQAREKVYWDRHYSIDRYANWTSAPAFEHWRTTLAARRKALDFLGPVAGKRCLMCGAALDAVVFAAAGADVYGFDISDNLVQQVAGLASRLGLSDRVHLTAMPFEEMDYPDEFFDLAYGAAILHHVDLQRATSELARVLKPRGRAAFVEPLGENPLLEFARRHLPYRGKHRTVDEQPLRYRDIQVLTRVFPVSKVEEVRLLGMLRWRVIRHRPTLRLLEAVDWVLLRALPPLRRFCSQVWVGVEKADSP